MTVDQQSLGFADRATALMNAHSWMDHPTVASVAANTPDPATAVNVGHGIGETLRQTWDGFTQSYSDPVLQQAPSPGLAIARYVHETIGAPPIEAGSLPQIQQALRDHGVGAGLAVDGEWTPQWQQAWNDQMNQIYADQLAGNKPGSTKTSSFLHRVLHTFTPAGIGDALIGWGKDVRNLLGDTVAGLIDVPHEIAQGVTSNPFGADPRMQQFIDAAKSGDTATMQQLQGLDHTRAASVAGGFITGRTPQQFNLDETQRGLSDALTILSIIPVGRLVGMTASKVGADFARGVLPANAPELARGPRVIAKTLFRASDPAADSFPNQLISSRWYDNQPLIGRLAPAVARTLGNTAEADGWYYTMRSALAQAYRLPAVRAAGQAYAGGMRTSIALNAAATATPGTAFGKNIQTPTVLDAWSTNLANASPRFFGMSLTDPNNLQLLLHGPLAGAERSSQVMGAHVRDTQNRIIDTLGAKGFPAAIQQALADGNTIMSKKAMLEAVGGDPAALDQFTRNLATQVARAHYIERTVGKTVDGTDPAAMDAAAAADKRFYTQPGVAAQALKESLEGDPDVQWATNRLKQIFLKNQTDPRKAFSAAYADWYATTKAGQAAHASGDTAYFQTPQGNAVLSDLRAKAAQEHLDANTPAPWEDPTGQALRAALSEHAQGRIGDPELQAARQAAADAQTSRVQAAQRHAKTAVSQADAQRIIPQEAGMFGLAKVGYKTSGDVNREAAQFEARLAAASDPVNKNRIFNEMRRWMYDNATRDVRELDVFAPTPEKLLDQMRAFGAKQAGDVSLRMGTPEAVQERFNAIKDSGYKWIVGSHIGHVIDGTEPDLGQLGNYTKPLRRWAQRMALNPSNIRNEDVGRATHLSMLSSLIDTMRNDPALTTWGTKRMVTANSILGLLVKDKAIDGMGLPWYQRAVVAGTSKVGLNKSNIERAVKGGATTQQAQAKLEADLAYQQSVRDLPRQRIIDTLTKPQTVKLDSGAEWNWPGMPAKSADRIYAALMRGYKLPTYMMGASAIENWARAGVGFGDRMTRKLPDDNMAAGPAKFAANLLDRVGQWPNTYVRIRNQLRFTLNPRFDEQRLTKTSYKMGLEGVPPVKNPLDTLMRTGQDTAALNRYERLTGEIDPTLTQHLDTDKYARSQSIWGIFSPVWHAAYFMQKQADKGMADADILASYHRAFTYGSGGGRSAFERTINTILFPFSFEKTVMRNGIGYLLDHPGQALLLSAAVDEWRKLDKNDRVGKFAKAYAPALVLANQLNAFAHGISPGQLGGINAPLINPVVNSLVAGGSMPAHDPQGHLLNLLTPQVWAKNYTKANIQQMAPLWKEFGQVLKAGHDQARVGFNLAANGMDDVLARKGLQDRTLIAPGAQLDYALKAKANMVTQAQAAIDYNQQQTSKADMIRWPYQPNLPADIQGEPVNRTTIGLYVAFLYPAYSPNAAAKSAADKAIAADKFIAQIAKTDPTTAAEMTSFKDVANQVIGKINRDAYDPSELATIQDQFRTAAKNLAEKNGQWLLYYQRYFASRLGPIIDFTGKGIAP